MLPLEMRELEELYPAGATRDASSNIRHRLRPLRDLFKVSRYRPAPHGVITIGESESGGAAAKRDVLRTGPGFVWARRRR